MALVKLQTKQVANLVNDATKNFLGGNVILNEDLTNVVDMGVAIQNADLYENVTNGLLLRIGYEIFVDRKYNTTLPSIYKNNVEYGQIIAKTRGKLDKAYINQSWELVNGASYDDNQYVESTTETKLFAKRDAYEIRKSIPDEQLKGAFTSPEALIRYVSMLFTMVANSIEMKRELLVHATISNFIGLVNANGKNAQNIHLLTEYNALKGTTLTSANALYDKEFLQYATGRIKHIQSMMTRYSNMYSLEGADTFTPIDLQHLLLLDLFAQNTFTYLSSSTFHDEFVKLPYNETIPYWQGSGVDGALADLSKIDITTSNGDAVVVNNVIGVLFDHDALGMTEDKPSVQTHYVKSSEFTNYWFKEKVGYFNDTNENFVVFYLD